MTTKEKILAAVETLPDDVSYDEAIERIQFVRKVEEGLAQAERGEGIEHEEFMRQLLAEHEES